MGRYGAAILTVVGTIVGAYFGFPALGAVLGSLVGSLLFPTQLPTVQGPRLADLGQTSSTVGAPIIRGWGTFVSPGCVIAKTDAREVIESEEVGGKGSSSQTVETPAYYQDFAIGLCDAERPIAGVRCIWANGKAIYDRRPKRDDESEAAFNVRMAASSQLDQIMTVYLGEEDQEPDPTLEQFFGVGNISAFRGLAYIVFENWKNKDEDGRRMPSQWKIEVYYDGEPSISDGSQYSNEVLFPWLSGGDPMNSLNEHTILNVYGGTTDGSKYFSDGPFGSVSEAVATHESLVGTSFNNYLGYGHSAGNPPGEGLGPETAGYTQQMGAPSARSTDAYEVYLIFNHFFADLQHAVDPEAEFQIFAAGDAVGATCGSEMVYHTNRVWAYAGPGSVNFRSRITQDTDTSGSGWEIATADTCGGPPYSFWSLSSVDVAVTVRRKPRAPLNPCLRPGAQEIPGIDGYVVVDGKLMKCGPWIKVVGTWRVLATYSGGGESVAQYPLNPARPEGHPEYNDEEFWTEAYETAVARGEIPSGYSYGTEYPKSQAFGYVQDIQNVSIETGVAQVQQIVSDLCVEAGLTTGDIDVTDLEPLTVPGYVRTRVMTARAALDPLRQATFFDGIESAPGVKFIRRGKPIVATLVDTTEDSDMAAHVVGEEIPSRITSRDLDEVEMPRQIRLHFLSPERDYDYGEALSPLRPNTSAKELDLELPIVLSNEQAAKIVSALWADAWFSRRVHEAVIDYSWQELEPADSLAVPIDNEVHRCRIVSIVDVLPAVRKLSLVRDDDQSFVSYALPSTPPKGTAPPPPVIALPANVIFLDLPLLRDADNDAGFYAAAWSPLTGVYGGAGIYRSIDGGANYTRVAQAGTQGTIGRLLNLLADGPTAVWDDGNEIRVELNAGELESASVEAVLLGANGAAVGAPGRWEIVQFRNVEYLGGSVYLLGGLLRGRRGTEHNTALHEQDDRFVLLSTAAGSMAPGLLRIPLSLSQVGREYVYKGVGAGTAVDAAIPLPFIGRGEALKPFSPVYVHGERASNGQWTITWLRRGRIGQTLQSGHDIPLSEDEEDYEVEIYNGAILVRTLSVLHESATYTPEQQLTDFGALQSSLKVIIYQLSAQVGRGTGAEVTL